jgi:ATPase subunit of ABC transporter with duplicated ATPase domains
MIVVSHDRYLLQRLADKVLWLRGGAATLIDGGYEAFEDLQRPGVTQPAAKPKAKPAPKPAAAPPPAPNGRAAKDIAAIEREVARLDAEKARLEREFADPAIYDDRERVATLERELADVRAAVDAAYERWERLTAATA